MDRGRTVIAMDCALAGALLLCGRPLRIAQTTLSPRRAGRLPNSASARNFVNGHVYNGLPAIGQLLTFPNAIRFARKQTISFIGQSQGASCPISTETCEMSAAAFRGLFIGAAGLLR